MEEYMKPLKRFVNNYGNFEADPVVLFEKSQETNTNSETNWVVRSCLIEKNQKIDNMHYNFVYDIIHLGSFFIDEDFLMQNEGKSLVDIFNVSPIALEQHYLDNDPVGYSTGYLVSNELKSTFNLRLHRHSSELTEWIDPRSGKVTIAINHEDMDYNNQSVVFARFNISGDILNKFLLSKSSNLLVGFHYQKNIYNLKEIQEEIHKEISETDFRAELRIWYQKDDETQVIMKCLDFKGFKIVKPQEIEEEPVFFLVKDSNSFQKLPLYPSRSVGRDDYLKQIYFDTGILEELKSLGSITVTGDGEVERGIYWGTYRKFRQVGFSLIKCHFGDFCISIPPEYWNDWAKYNVKPPTNDEESKMNNQGNFISRVRLLEKTLIDLNSLFQIITKIPLFTKNESDSYVWDGMKWSISSDFKYDKLREKINDIWLISVDRLNKTEISKFLDSMNVSLKFKDNSKNETGSLFQFSTCIEYIFLMYYARQKQMQYPDKVAVNMILEKRGLVSAQNEEPADLQAKHKEFDKFILPLFEILFNLNKIRNELSGHEKIPVMKVLTKYNYLRDSVAETWAYIFDEIIDIYSELNRLFLAYYVEFPPK